MPPNLKAYGRVLEEARRWGVRVVISKTLPIEALIGPRLGALDHKTATIHLLDYELAQVCTGDGPLWLLHEIAHALMRQGPSTVDEIFSGLFAVERRMALDLRLPGYRLWVDTFYRYNSRPMSEVPACQRASILWISTQAAIREGLLDSQGQLTHLSRNIPKSRRHPCSTSPPGR